MAITRQPTFDHRDEAVLELLREAEGDVFAVRDLHRAYRLATDVRRKETLKDRTQYLTTYGPFERDGSWTWRLTD